MATVDRAQLLASAKDFAERALTAYLDNDTRDWSQLQDARGAATEVPRLLEQVEPGPESWAELWARLCPQGAVFSASVAALPRLTDLAAGWAPAERTEPLLLAGAILGSEEPYHQVSDARQRYAAQISILRDLTDESLQALAGSHDTETYIYLLQALMAFDGVDVWDAHLDGLHIQEYEITCPNCTDSLFIALGDRGYFATRQDYAVIDAPVTTALQPADPASLQGPAATLHALATRDHQPTTAHQLTHLFGTATCSDCGTPLSIPDRIAAAFGHNS